MKFITLLYTFFLMILIPVYSVEYGLLNFLWVSDVGLFLTFFGLWFQSPLLISIAMLGVFPFEFIWTIDFIVRLITKRKFLNITEYMFNEKINLFIRALSLFHIFVSIIWIWLLYRWGYDARAIIWTPLLIGMLLILTFFLSKPEDNINWVFMPYNYHWTKIAPWQWLIIMIIGVPLIFFLPLHALYQHIF